MAESSTRVRELLTKLKGPANIKRMIVMEVERLENILTKEQIDEMIVVIDKIVAKITKDKN